MDTSTAGIRSRPYWTAAVMAARALQSLGKCVPALWSCQHLYRVLINGSDGGTPKKVVRGSPKYTQDSVASTAGVSKPSRKTASWIACSEVEEVPPRLLLSRGRVQAEEESIHLGKPCLQRIHFSGQQVCVPPSLLSTSLQGLPATIKTQRWAGCRWYRRRQSNRCCSASAVFKQAHSLL